MSQISDILTELRRDKGLTQKALAEEFNISASTISAYELGERLPSVDTISQYARRFDVTSDYILGLSRIQERLSSFTEEFVSGYTIGNMLHDMSKLLPEQKQALLVTIRSMVLYAQVLGKQKQLGDNLK